MDLSLTLPEYLVTEENINSLNYEATSLPDVDSVGNYIQKQYNSYAIFQNEFNTGHTALARYIGDGAWSPITKKGLKFEKLSPRNAEQACFMDALANERIMLNVCIGSAGVGKTTIALAYALHQYLHSQKNIVLTKPMITIGAGKALGPVPGTIEEKSAPYLVSYEIILKKLLGGNSASAYIEQMKEKESLQFFPIELVRGCTFENCTLIVDEAQNMNWHELNSVISRMGEKSKIILLGDLNQIDTRTPYNKTGLFQLLSAPPFQDSEISSAIELTTQYRSPITQLVTEVNKWIMTH